MSTRTWFDGTITEGEDRRIIHAGPLAIVRQDYLAAFWPADGRRDELRQLVFQDGIPTLRIDTWAVQRIWGEVVDPDALLQPPKKYYKAIVGDFEFQAFSVRTLRDEAVGFGAPELTIRKPNGSVYGRYSRTPGGRWRRVAT